MPSYLQQCDSCGLRHEVSLSFSARDKKVPCPSCGVETRRLPPNRISSDLDLPIQGVGPQSTGTSLDHDLDRVVGKAAEIGWRFQERRYLSKRAVLQANPGRDPQDMTRNPDGSWGFLPSGAGKSLQGISSEIAKMAPPDTNVPDSQGVVKEPGVPRR